MPGILPSSASSRKQMRQRLKSRIKPRGRPHLKQRRTVRVENFGTRSALIIIDFLAIKIRPKRRSLKFLHPTFRMLGYGNFVRALFLAVILRQAQDLAKKQSPLRGSGNIREVGVEVKPLSKPSRCTQNSCNKKNTHHNTNWNIPRPCPKHRFPLSRIATSRPTFCTK